MSYVKEEIASQPECWRLAAKSADAPGLPATRERVPVLVRLGQSVQNLGVRDGFADVAATLRTYFHLPAGRAGQSFF